MSQGIFALLLLLNTALVFFGIFQLYRINREGGQDRDKRDE